MAYPVAVAPAGGQRTWTVLGEDYATVGPVEEWIEAHRHLWSPNTVRGYATSLAQWWSFLEQRGQTADWGDVGVPAVSAFLSGCATAARWSTAWPHRSSHRRRRRWKPVWQH